MLGWYIRMVPRYSRYPGIEDSYTGIVQPDGTLRWTLVRGDGM